ncbi:MAG: hypothetical protein IH984_14505 [Planctomycetes bacterium]|nr:hypothetical protein [Planctomycetota bacterium]
MSTADISSVPPTVAGELPPKPIVWPKTLGIICIVLGALGIIQGCFGVLSIFATDWVTTFVPQQQAEMMDSVESLQPLLIISGVIFFALAATLLAAGIGMVLRKLWSRKTVLIWSGTKMAFVVANSILNYMVQKAQFEEMQEMLASDPNAAAAMSFFGQLMMWMGMLMIVIMIIWGCALPVFTLIWFSRKKVRIEVASWGEASPVPAPVLSTVPPIEETQSIDQEVEKKYWRSDSSD